LIERYELAPGYSVCRVINGLWQLSDGHRSESVQHDEALRGLLRLVDAGFTTFDCADIYLGVEELLGRLARELKRSKGDAAAIEIHTKYVPDRSALATLQKTDVAAGIESSLTRLGVERLDLVQFHWWDYDQPKYVDVAGWLTELRDEGKIRNLGTTNFDLPHLRELITAGIPIVTNQAQYSLLDRRAGQALTEFCSNHGVRLLCYGVLAGGFLSERYRHAPEPQPPFDNRSLAKYKLIIDEFGGWSLFQELLGILGEIGAKHSAPMASVATRWVLEQEGVAAVMIGTRSDAHLDDTRQAFSFRLDDEDRNRISSILERAKGPLGEPFELEREPDGPHARIMWTDLNTRRKS
jgi:aryl-alcohol dehydrogenase-like predicted oxidoreductase